MNLDKIRNIGIAAHVDAGKTTVTERILFYAGRTHKIGEVHEGTTITDWMAQERERGITITSAATYVNWKDYEINIIDTPGHVDFTIEVERSLRVMDGVIVVFCAVGGVQSQSETVWRQSDRYNVPRLSFINKMDRVGADYIKVINEMKDRLHANPVLCQIPVGIEDKHQGIIDLINMKALIYRDDDKGKLYETADIPDEYRDDALAAREKLLEALTLEDEDLLDAYYKDIITPQLITSALRRATIASKITPVFLGSAYKNKGIQPLLDAVLSLLPGPLDVPPVEGQNLKNDDTYTVECDPGKPFAGLAFKVQHDSYLGKLTYIRVYQGSLKKGMQVFNTRESKKERILKLLRMHANHKEEIEMVHAGQLCAVGGLKFTTTGDTLTDQLNIALETIFTPEPVVRVAIEPDSVVEQEKLQNAIDSISQEDPTFKVFQDQETGQMIVAGMGELHLEIIVDRIKREFKVDAKVGKPQVAFKETITKEVVEDVSYEGMAGNRTVFGKVKLRVEPKNKQDHEISFNNECDPEIVPKEFHDAVKRGALQSITGPLGGYPLIGLNITFIGGGYHESESTEIGFEIAASMAIRQAVENAHPVLMEPVMKIEIEAPNEFMGEVIGDMASRRGTIERTVAKSDGMVTIIANAPLSEMFGYTTALRSVTQGRASSIMEFDHYSQVPDSIAKNIVFF